MTCYRRDRWLRGGATPDPCGTEPATPKTRNRRDRWLREGATPDHCKMQKATLPDRLCWYRKNRWLRGPATNDSCDWSSELFPVWQLRSAVALRSRRSEVRVLSGAPSSQVESNNSGWAANVRSAATQGCRHRQTGRRHSVSEAPPQALGKGVATAPLT